MQGKIHYYHKYLNNTAIVIQLWLNTPRLCTRYVPFCYLKGNRSFSLLLKQWIPVPKHAPPLFHQLYIYDVVLDCVTVTVGSSEGNRKRVTGSVSLEYACPTHVDKNNWVNSATWADTFTVEKLGTQVTVMRTDSNGGWGMNLLILCCTGNSRRYKPAYVFL